ncbi:MAG TPA: tetratricopeptide repeat protein [Terriglobia bacterium]|nr:tetratricopeptide repeat protein [Terriglobia bacterium]
MGYFFLRVVVLLFVIVIPVRADLRGGKQAYEHGDYATALKELRPLADQGNAEAQALLGLMYNLGRGVPRDYVQAEKWYRAAADQGNAQAECQLGSMYLKKDPTRALKLLKLSAEQGFSDSYLIIGLAYMSLKDVPRDLVEADMWLNLAAAHDDPLGASQRARCESQMTPNQVAKARALAAAWKPKTAPGPNENTQK